ncbi:MAG: GIY-YIG nuclease family protein [Spirochaetaceae bacterium]|nr:MAG: GIY-YIG nuclease family protein [Spirochaetaceae bacterium]
MKDGQYYWIYMLRLANGSYYTGYARDLEKRVHAHRSGRGAKITRSFCPVAVAACWKLYSDKGAAMGIEAWIKNRSREAKQTLVDHPETLRELLLGEGREEPIEPVIPPPVITQ